MNIQRSFLLRDFDMKNDRVSFAKIASFLTNGFWIGIDIDANKSGLIKKFFQDFTIEIHFIFNLWIFLNETHYDILFDKK